MKQLPIIALLVCCFIFSQAQNSKGLTLVNTQEEKQSGKTYALIVGISKYKNPAIPPLQYADRDAIAFRSYLVATGVDSNNIFLLLNEKATNGEFWADLDYFARLAKRGDKFYIYFSGHGDVENITVVKDAYLLPYDAPHSVYPIAAIAVSALKSWIATFSSNGVQTIFVADACRSGNLVGGLEGKEEAARALSDKWQDEIKILSCQPGEVSLEGKDWGNGRGLFSYELLKGLAGKADLNKDGIITLRELDLYLLGNVPEEASPLKQNPLVSGDMGKTIATVNPKFLLKPESNDTNPKFYALNTRGLEETLLHGMNDSIKQHFRLFNAALDSGNVTAYIGKVTAYTRFREAYTQLSKVPLADSTHLLVALMNRNFTARILHETDSIISRIVSNKTYSFGGFIFEALGTKEIKFIRNYLGDAKLKALGYYAKILYFTLNLDVHDSIAAPLMAIDSAIQYDSTAAYLYWRKSMYLKDSIKERIYNLYHALRFSPNFAIAIKELADNYLSSGQTDSALYYLHRLRNSDSSLASQTRIEEAGANYKLGRPDVADRQVDSSIAELKHTLLPYKLIMNRADDSLFGGTKPLADRDSEAYYLLLYKIALSLMSSKAYVKVVELLKISMRSKLDNYGKDYILAQCYNGLKRKEDALKYLEKALKSELKMKESDLLLTNFVLYIPDVPSKHEFDFIYDSPEYKELIKRYTPKPHKE